ncbi:hypothetical protein ABIE41_003465 [Bosea sp. OAE506]
MISIRFSASAGAIDWLDQRGISFRRLDGDRCVADMSESDAACFALGFL